MLGLHKHHRSGSTSSSRSTDSLAKFGEGGISVGVGRATVGGISNSQPGDVGSKRSSGRSKRSEI